MKKYIGLVSFLLLFTLTSCAQNKQETVKLLSMEALEKMEALAPEKALESPEEVVKLNLVNVEQKYFHELGKFKNLQYLKLEANKLGKIPAGVFKLKNLQYLNISSNQISNLSADFGELSSLQVLYLGNNPLESLPTEFMNLKELKFLSLINTNIKSYPKALGKLSKLEEIVLQNGNVTTLPEQFSELSAMKAIYLNYNPEINLKQVCGVLSKLPKLEEIVLTNSNIKELPSELSGLIHLKKFSIDAKVLDVQQALTTLKNLPKLEFIYIYKLSALPEEVEKLKQLKKATFWLQRPTQTNWETLFDNLAKVKLLEDLQVYGGGGKEVPKQIEQFQKLKYLRLAGNALTTLPEEIKKLKNLKLLNLEMNKFPPEEKVRIKKLLPNTEIKF
ncbi:leucine-rich repeat domain-containing protein [uncultured Microscilla sp.]|uniref:leucine-rich repeat domain-containing protein n=1 Tax=uncultured Microscilla sp. TaxID=432653 RepID=UPI0026192C83|nr:leucine-rich repeat domain-containing protein [uncultured Microscilla sp.]